MINKNIFTIFLNILLFFAVLPAMLMWISIYNHFPLLRIESIWSFFAVATTYNANIFDIVRKYEYLISVFGIFGALYIKALCSVYCVYIFNKYFLENKFY